MSIGEAARLVGVTTKKTIRHYEKVRLLGAPQRSEAGYRLYAAADDLLRLQRVRRLQSLGLSLDHRIKGVLVEPGTDARLREVLEALLVEVEGQLAAPEERQERIRETLDREDPELPEGSLGPEVGEGVPGRLPQGSEPLARRAGAKDMGDARGLRLARGVSERARFPGTLLRAIPEEYRAALALDERLVLLADMPEDSPGVVLVWSGLLDPAEAVLVVVGIEVILFATAIGEVVLMVRRYWRAWAAGLNL